MKFLFLEWWVGDGWIACDECILSAGILECSEREVNALPEEKSFKKRPEILLSKMKSGCFKKAFYFLSMRSQESPDMWVDSFGSESVDSKT